MPKPSERSASRTQPGAKSLALQVQLAGPQQVGVTDPRLLGEICGGGGGLRRSPGSGGETEGTRGETGLVVCWLGRVVLPSSGAACGAARPVL